MADTGAKGEIPDPQDAFSQAVQLNEDIEAKGEIHDPFNREKPLPVKDIVVDKKYMKRFPNLSKEELQKYIALSDCEDTFIFKARYKDSYKAGWNKQGKRAVHSQPSVFMLSVSVTSQDESLAIYGTINAGRWDVSGMMHTLFEREENNAQLVGTGGDLAFNSSSARDCACLPLLPGKIDVELKLFQGTGECFTKNRVELDFETEDASYGGVKYKFITDDEGVKTTLSYIVIPFGFSCCINISIFYRQSTKRDYPLSVSGKIVAKYGNTYDKYTGKGIECVVFDKHGKEFEEVHKEGSLQLSRRWVALPAYSSLVVAMDLCISRKGHKDVLVKNNCIELLPQQGGSSDDSIVLDDYIITADVGWFSPDYHWPSQHTHYLDTFSDEDEEEEEMEDEGEDESVNDDVAKESSSNTNIYRYQPRPFHALEIFSVFIGLENPPAQVQGSIEVLSKDKIVCSIFKMDDEKALSISKHSEVIPVSDGYRVFYRYAPLELKIDVRDANSSLAIKGYGDWETHFLDPDLWYDKQLCSLIRGEHGFAAVHYSIFKTGLVANIKAILKDGINSKVCGRIMAEYSYFDHSSKYRKDCYRSVLFRRTEDDAFCFKTETDPLPLSKIFVPSYSALVLEIDLLFGESLDKKLLQVIWIDIAGQPWTIRRSIIPETIGTNVEVGNTEETDEDYPLSVKVGWKRMHED